MVSMLLLPLLVGILAFVVVFIAVLLVFPAATLLLPLPQPSLSSTVFTVPVSLRVFPFELLGF